MGNTGRTQQVNRTSRSSLRHALAPQLISSSPYKAGYGPLNLKQVWHGDTSCVGITGALAL